MPDRVIIIGGGLAGLAAATALAIRDCAVTLFESRPRLGGRASSFSDPTTGQLIDACQHVSMACCTNFDHFCKTVGIASLLEPQPQLHFMTRDGQVSAWQADARPSPLHYARSFLRAHFLTWADKLRIGLGLLALRRARPNFDPPLLDWLLRHHQTPRTIERFWSVVLTSALNESPDRLGLRYARKVFVDAFLGHPHGGVVHVPTVPLGRLYGDELYDWLKRHQVAVRLGEGVRELEIEADEVRRLLLRGGDRLPASHVILAVPHDRVLSMLPPSVRGVDFFSRIASLAPSPILSVHLWYDRPILTLPHVVLVGCVGQWVFNRGQSAPGEHYVQVVISAARKLRELGNKLAQELVVAELRELFPIVREATLLRARVVTEHVATFSAVPGVDGHRPPQTTPVRNLFLAGDWTCTGWPATMEGAVRSGYLAAEGLLARLGRAERLVQPDLRT
jgi:squalene-associated FAD-dependent desaturase